jgi:hypothetical protein
MAPQSWNGGIQGAAGIDEVAISYQLSVFWIASKSHRSAF